jgi:hypothetical protein
MIVLRTVRSEMLQQNPEGVPLRKRSMGTSEGVDVGPYDTREAADAGGARLAKALHGVDDPIAARKIIREFMYLMGTHVQMP